MSRLLGIAAVQMAPVELDQAASFAKLATEVRRLSAASPQLGLIIFPELFLTGMATPSRAVPTGYVDAIAESIPGPLTSQLCALAKVEVHGRPVGLSNHHESAAAEIAGRRPGDGERECDGHGGVDGVAALLHDVAADARGDVAGRGHHGVLRQDGRFRCSENRSRREQEKDCQELAHRRESLQRDAPDSRRRATR